MNKKTKLFICIIATLTSMLLIAATTVLTVFVMRISSTKAEENTLAIGHIDIETRTVYVGYGDAVFSTKQGGKIATAQDYFSDSFGSAKNVAGFTYTQISSNGRFLVINPKTGESIWVKPTWEEYINVDGEAVKSIDLAISDLSAN